MSFLKVPLILALVFLATQGFAQEQASAPSFDVQLFENDVLVSQATLQLKELKDDTVISNSTSKVSVLKDALNALVEEVSRANTVSNTTTIPVIKNCHNEEGQSLPTLAPETEGVVWNLTSLGDNVLLSGDFSKLTKIKTFTHDNCFVELPQKQVFSFSQAFPKNISNPFVIEGIKNDATYRVTITPVSSTK